MGLRFERIYGTAIFAATMSNGRRIRLASCLQSDGRRFYICGSKVSISFKIILKNYVPFFQQSSKRYASVSTSEQQKQSDGRHSRRIVKLFELFELVAKVSGFRLRRCTASVDRRVDFGEKHIAVDFASVSVFANFKKKILTVFFFLDRPKSANRDRRNCAFQESPTSRRRTCFAKSYRYYAAK